MRRRERFDDEPPAGRRGRLTEEERGLLAALREENAPEQLPDGAERWSTWETGERDSQLPPAWLVTELAAVDHELGVLKTGREADVHLLRRSVPGTSRSGLPAAKRCRSSEHRLFHREAGYLEGRRTRCSRENRTSQPRVLGTGVGRNAVGGGGVPGAGTRTGHPRCGGLPETLTGAAGGGSAR